MAVIEAIQTTYLEVDVGNIYWSSIPQTYKHLQIRASLLDHNVVNTAGNFTLAIYFNSDNNYTKQATHLARGYGSTRVGYSSAAWSTLGYMGAEPDLPGSAVFVIDILDYTNTNKKTVSFSINGYVGTTNNVEFGSSMWHTHGTGGDVNAAVSQIMLHSPGGAGFVRGGVATLYGINGS